MTRPRRTVVKTSSKGRLYLDWEPMPRVPDEYTEFTALETELLAACRIALRQLNYDGDDKTAFAGAASEALTKAIAAAEITARCGQREPYCPATPPRS